MLSTSGKNWKETSINQRIVDKAKNDNDLTEIQAKIIIKRKFTELEVASLSNNIEVLNPFLRNQDFKNGHYILDKSIKNNEKVLIIGDYDVDGCVSASLFVNFFKLINKEVEYYIPNRFKDGYGASLKLIKQLVKKKPHLIIMVDCGSNSNDAIEFLNKNNIRSIIIDHHEIYQPYPKSGILINPKKDCNYKEFDYFCTATLVYFFINSFLKKKDLIDNFKKNLFFVLLASICDVMPLRKLNRIIAIEIFRNLKYYNNYLLSKIFELKKKNSPYSIDDFGFLFGPILNSAGRLDDANKIVELLTTDNIKTKDRIIQNIIEINEKRKKIEERFIKDINLRKISKIESNVLIICENIAHEGIIGIAASKLKEYFNKPTIVITKSKDEFKASARSTLNFNIGKSIKDAIDKKIILNGGGHNLAAGFSIKKDKIKKFSNFINEIYEKNKLVNSNEYISKISLSAINYDFFKNLQILGPFGPFNENPIFLVENIKILKPKILKDKFISCYAKSKSSKLFPVISFNLIESEINQTLLYNKNEMSLIVKIKENVWNNKKNLQLIVLDTITNLNNT